MTSFMSDLVKGELAEEQSADSIRITFSGDVSITIRSDGLAYFVNEVKSTIAR